MECSINHLGIGDTTANAASSIQKYETYKTFYHELLEENMQVIGNLSNDFTVHRGKDINFAREKIYMFEKTSKKLLSSMAMQKHKAVIECVSTLMYSDTNEAVGNIKWLYDDLQLRGLIQEAYRNFGMTDILNFIIRFIEELPTCRHEKIASKALIEAMKIMRKNESIEEVCYFSNIQNICPFDFDDMKTDITSFTIHTWVENVLNGSLGVYQYAKICRTDFLAHLGDIIRISCGRNLENFDKVFNFIFGFPEKADQALALIHLFNQIKAIKGFDGPEILMLAYEAQELINVVEYEQKLRNIVDSSPALIQHIVKQFYVYIINSFNNLYLNFEASTNKTLICPHKSSDSFLSAMWRLIVIERGRYVALRNYRYDRDFLCYFDNEVKLVHYANENEANLDLRCHWQAFPVLNGTKAYFKNRSSGKIIVAASNDFGNTGWKSIETGDAYTSEERSLWRTIIA